MQIFTSRFRFSGRWPLLCLGLLLALPLQAALPEWAELQMLEDLQGQWDAQAVAKADAQRFRATSGVIDGRGYSDATLWLRGRIQQPAEGRPWLLRALDIADADRICVYWPRQRAEFLVDCRGLEFGKDHGWHGAFAFVPPADLDAKRAVVLEVVNRTWLQLRLDFAPREGYQSQVLRQGQYWGLYYGAMLTLCLTALLAWIFVGGSTFAWYAVHLGLAALAFVCWQGWPLEQNWWGAAWWTRSAPAFLLGLFGLSGVVFYARFLQLRETTWAYWPYMTIGACSLAVSLLSFWDPTWAYLLLGIAAILYAFGTIGVALLALRWRNAEGVQVLCAMGLLLLAGALKGAEALGLALLPATSLNVLLRIGVLLGALALVLGLGARMRAMRRQRDSAREFAEASQRLAQRQAERDELSGVLTRRAWLAEVEHRHAELAGVAVLRLTGTYQYERARGCAAMELLLRNYAAFLRRWGGEVGVVGRVGHLSFAIASSGLGMSENRLGELRQRSREMLAALDPVLGVQLGVASLRSTEAEGALHEAEIAVWQDEARDDSKNGPVDEVRHDTILAVPFHASQVELHFQPILPSSGKGRVNCEALVRLRRLGALLYPGEFLPGMPDPTQLRLLTDAVVEKACQQMASWRASGLQVGHVAINLFAADLLDPHLAVRLRRLVDKQHQDPRQLVFELSENTLVRHVALARDALNALRHAGFGTAIDDFGSGYTSVAWLRSLPVDWLKLDKSLVDEVPDSEEACAIMDTLRDLAARLDLQCVVEGVEESSQRAYLGQDARLWLQGYLLARPLEGNRFGEWVLSRQRGAAAAAASTSN